MLLMRVLVIGGVESTAITIKALHRHQFEIVGVLGHEPARTSNVSGWTDLKQFCADQHISYRPFIRINDDDHQQWASSSKIDIIFAVGLSQLLQPNWNNLARLGCIGFHPTFLPKGRGRTPMAWLILEQAMGAATYFLLGESTDDGAIFVQEPFSIHTDDDAESAYKKLYRAMNLALDRWLPQLLHGSWDPTPQDESMATWHGIRRPEDGLINWNQSASKIDRLIKATTRPHPGAYTFTDREKLCIYKSTIEKSLPINGSVGRILLVKEEKLLIQCGAGLLWIYDIEPKKHFRVGQKLGLNLEEEIIELWKKLGEQSEL